jgi:phosphatidylserine/phosphatidylglycerophosphate/cardiolipin synthase-like enzyme
MEEKRYSGKSAYQFIDQLIRKRSAELLIISPYISNYYVKTLLKESGRKRIRIITSKVSLGYKDSMLKNLQNSCIGGYLKAIAYFAVLDAITIYFKLSYAAIIVALLLTFSFIMLLRRRRKTASNITVKTTGDDFVHEKLYISDSMAIVGSANLTYSGMHKNVEHIQMIDDKGEIKELKEHFNSLWGKY